MEIFGGQEGTAVNVTFPRIKGGGNFFFHFLDLHGKFIN